MVNNMRKYYGVFMILLAAGALFTILFRLKLPSNSLMWREIHNTGHVPLFGGLALCILGLNTLLSSKGPSDQRRRYFAAFAGAISLGALFELSQYFTPGDPSISDLLRDVVGAGLFLGTYMIFDLRMKPAYDRNRGLKALVIFTTALFSIIAFLPLALWAGAYAYRDRAFPRMLDFESRWEEIFTETYNSTLERVKPPSGWKDNRSAWAGRLTFRTQERSGFYLQEPAPNWTAFDTLMIEVYSLNDTAVQLSIRIDDAGHNQQYDDRFNRRLTILPGHNRIAMPLDDIRYAPKNRAMDLRQIVAIYIFAIKPAIEYSVYLDNLELTAATKRAAERRY